MYSCWWRHHYTIWLYRHRFRKNIRLFHIKSFPSWLAKKIKNPSIELIPIKWKRIKTPFPFFYLFIILISMKLPYSASQIQELLAHPYISSCTSKYLSFTEEGKQKMLHLSSSQYMTPREIFRSFSFPEWILQSSLPRDSLKRWKRKVKNEWVLGLVPQRKGRKKKEKLLVGIGPPDELEYLRAKVAYLEEENKTFRLIRAWKYEPYTSA